MYMIFFLCGDFHDLWSCHICIHTQSEGLQWFVCADSCSRTLPCLYCSGLYQDSFFPLTHFVCFCHLQRCNGRYEVSLISLVKHSRRTMFLIISHSEPLWGQGCLDRFLCVWNDEWWSLPCHYHSMRSRPQSMYGLMVSGCSSMSHGESCKALSHWG